MVKKIKSFAIEIDLLLGKNFKKHLELFGAVPLCIKPPEVKGYLIYDVDDSLHRSTVLKMQDRRLMPVIEKKAILIGHIGFGIEKPELEAHAEQITAYQEELEKAGVRAEIIELLDIFIAQL